MISFTRKGYISSHVNTFAIFFARHKYQIDSKRLIVNT